MSLNPPTGQIFTPSDLTDEVTEMVIEDLNKGLRHFEQIFKNRRFTENKDIIAGIFRGSATRIAGRAAIRVISEGMDTKWHATRVRDDIYRFSIDCLSKVTAKKEAIEEFMNTFAGAVHAYIIRFDNLQPIIKGTNKRAYDSWAESYTKGYTEGGAYRVARIPYYVKILNSYM